MSFKKSELMLRRWGKQEKPVRKIILWGWDAENNPSFLMLFGFHGFENAQVEITDSDIKEFNEEIILTGLSEYEREISPGVYNVLENNVGYFGYVLFRGNEGHFPNLMELSLKVSSSYDHYRKIRTYSSPYLVELKWRYDGEKYRPHRWDQLKSCRPIIIPYFKRISYNKLVEIIRNQGFSDPYFQFANSPNDILNLENENLRFLDTIVNLFSYDNLYMRQKYLKELLTLNPPKEILKKIIELGSSEVICGLLLDLAKEKNPILSEEIQELIFKPINWILKKYENGLKRCATIYLKALDPKLRANRINEIKEDIKDLELIPAYAKKPSRPKLLKKIEPGMSYNDYINSWSAIDWKYIGPSLTFKSNKFTDGFSLNHIVLKNILQEAYIFNLPEIIGKIAHFIDTPKFLYLMLRSKRYGTGVYFERYIIRIIKEYAHFSEENYIKVMKYFFSSYKDLEILISYVKEVEFNKLLKYFTKSPKATITGKGNRNKMQQFLPKIQSKDFKYNRNVDNYELRNKILQNNLEKILDILSITTVEMISNFLFERLKDAPNLDEILKNLPTSLLANLSQSKYSKISDFFNDKLLERMNRSKQYDPEIMLALLECSNTKMHSKAWDYLERVKGNFNPKTVVKMIWLKNIDYWLNLFKENVNKFNGIQYYEFITFLLNEILADSSKQTCLLERIIEILMKSTLKINEISEDKKGELIEIILDFLINESNIQDWLGKLVQNVICSIDFKNLTSIIKSLKLDFKKEIRSKYAKDLVSLLAAIKENDIPNDAQLLDIIDFGIPRMVDMLIKIISSRKTKLIERQTTLLLLFESNMMVLNDLASETFDTMPEKKRNDFLSVLIDSPIQKSYLIALKKLDDLFEEKIPKELIIQMLEHGAHQVKAYISNKINYIIDELSIGNKNADLFMYYFKTLVLLPNLYAKSKDKLYKIIPQFAEKNSKYIEEIQKILLKLGGSNIIKDSENALLALAKIKQEVGKFAA